MKAECLYYLAVVFIVKGEIFKLINGKELSRFFKGLYITNALENFFFVISGRWAYFSLMMLTISSSVFSL